MMAIFEVVSTVEISHIIVGGVLCAHVIIPSKEPAGAEL